MNLSSEQQITIRSNYPVPEINRTPLELLISKEEPLAFISLDAEITVFLADFSARWPDKWATVKERINDPRASYNDIAVRLHISRGAVRRHLEDLRNAAKVWQGGKLKDES